MPIYAYKCSACGHAKDALQKISDAPLTTCPACGAETFSKQVTAAGFQLKGSGWYVTDFRDGGKKEKASGGDKKPDGAATDGTAAKPAETAPASAPASTSASTTPAPAAD
jgi:putative FmdB family regulatory protein